MNGTKWVALIAVVLMIASMAMYVLSDDEAIEPGVSAGANAPQPAMADGAM